MKNITISKSDVLVVDGYDPDGMGGFTPAQLSFSKESISMLAEGKEFDGELCGGRGWFLRKKAQRIIRKGFRSRGRSFSYDRSADGSAHYNYDELSNWTTEIVPIFIIDGKEYVAPYGNAVGYVWCDNEALSGKVEKLEGVRVSEEFILLEALMAGR